jgi:hypothetical protein
MQRGKIGDEDGGDEQCGRPQEVALEDCFVGNSRVRETVARSLSFRLGSLMRH